MKKIILLSGIIIGCLMLTVIFPVQPVLAADKADLVPMELNGTEWAVEFTFSNKKGKKLTEEDTLIFADKKFISKRYDKKGYTPTNYSLSINEQDVTSFGTMQIKDKETSFWKGSVSGEEINGSVHVQYPSGDNETRYYKGTLSSGTLKRKEPVVRRKPVDLPPPVVKEEPVQAEQADPSLEEAQPVEVK